VWDKALALQSLDTLDRLQAQPGMLFVPGHDPMVWSELRLAPVYYD
jgi:hypothetical protein